MSLNFLGFPRVESLDSLQKLVTEKSRPPSGDTNFLATFGK